MPNTNPANNSHTITGVAVTQQRAESLLTFWSVLVQLLISWSCGFFSAIHYLTLNWHLYLWKYVSFKGGGYCFGRDCLLQHTSLVSGCHSPFTKWWLPALHLKGSCRIWEKEGYFQLKESDIHLQPASTLHWLNNSKVSSCWEIIFTTEKKQNPPLST